MNLPEATAFDYSVAAAKAISVLISFLIPPLGSAVSLFDAITAPIRGRRANEWCENLRLSLNALSATVAELTPEKLAASEEFTSAFAQAAQAAIRTHDQEKLEALRNAILNVALNQNPDTDKQAIFLSLIDSLTPVHLRMLKFLDGPKGNLLPSRLPKPLNQQKSMFLA